MSDIWKNKVGLQTLFTNKWVYRYINGKWWKMSGTENEQQIYTMLCILLWWNFCGWHCEHLSFRAKMDEYPWFYCAFVIFLRNFYVRVTWFFRNSNFVDARWYSYKRKAHPNIRPKAFLSKGNIYRKFRDEESFKQCDLKYQYWLLLLYVIQVYVSLMK